MWEYMRNQRKSLITIFLPPPPQSPHNQIVTACRVVSRTIISTLLSFLDSICCQSQRYKIYFYQIKNLSICNSSINIIICFLMHCLWLGDFFYGDLVTGCKSIDLSKRSVTSQPAKIFIISKNFGVKISSPKNENNLFLNYILL
jgi:hypothetical protein